MLSQKYLRFTPILLFLLLAEVISYACHFYPEMNTILFFVVCFFTLILSLTKLEYGLYILLAELFTGSKGYLFSLETGNLSFSIRIAIFLIVIGVWSAKLFEAWFKNYKSRTFGELVPVQRLSAINISHSKKNAWPKGVGPGAPNSNISSPKVRDKQTKKFWNWPPNFFNFRKSNLAKWYIILFIFIAWGLIQGIIRNNGFANVFFDFNAWLYFALVFVFFDVIKSQEQIKNILIVLYASLTLLAIRTLAVLYVFSHQFQSLMPSIYRWITDFKLGEIAPIKFGFYRVFIQSQIYCLVGFFVVLSLIFFKWFKARNPEGLGLWAKSQGPRAKSSMPKAQGSQPRAQSPKLKALFVIAGLPLLISFSRSYWVGILGGLFALFIFLKLTFRIQWSKIFKIFGFLILTGVIEIGIVYLIINLPPKSGSMIDFRSLMEERITKQEAASQSRVNQILPLIKSISKHPIIGSGFGTTVTYKSLDPRQITESNPEGWYTTYAFEWNYLDIILKLGLAGLIVYLILIWKIFKKGWKTLARSLELRAKGLEPTVQNPQLIAQGSLLLGLFLGLIAVITTNVFSPYLNHPLGIGYLLLCSAIFTVLEKE